MRFYEFNDKAGRKYKNCFFPREADALFCFNEENLCFSGVPKVVVREGKSAYGEQLIIQFLIKGRHLSYKANSKHNVIEIYLPKAEGLRFLEESIKKIKGSD